jgi:tetratricopeptide (TPR) repeat protein
MRKWLVAVVMLASVAQGEAPRRGSFLNISELMKLMEESKTAYVFKELEKLDLGRGTLAEAAWPALLPRVNCPKVVRKDGQVSVVEWEQSAELGAALKRGDEAYAKKDFVEAEKRFRAAVKLAPGDPLAHAFLGDALLFGGKTTEAKAEYDRAIELNPDDYRLYFFRAGAWRRLGVLASERDDLRTSLTLKPRNSMLLESVEPARLGVRVGVDVLVPQGFARREKEQVVIYADAQRLGWFSWASCKGAWLGESEHRKAATGSERRSWTSTEELECLSALLVGYDMELKRGGPRDPRLDQLKAIADDGQAVGLVLYEIGARVDPQFTLRLDAESRSRVRKYVEKYVLPDAPARAEDHADGGE